MTRHDETQASAEALDWFARLGAASNRALARQDFRAWYDSSAENARAWDRIAGLWASPELERAARRLRRREPLPPAARPAAEGRPAWRRGFAALAASLLLLIGLGLLAGGPQRAFLWLEADLRSGPGERRSLVLEDGSSLILAPASAVAVDFTVERRRILLLAGGAYVEVRPDPARPFVVDSAEGAARALGTGYSLELLGEGARVAVRHGRVAAGEGAQAKVLQGAQQVLLSDGLAGSVLPLDPVEAFAWLEGRLIFKNRPLGEVVADLRRSYPGLIVMLDQDLQARRVSGNYRLEDPGLLLAALAEVAGARLIRVADAVFLLR